MSFFIPGVQLNRLIGQLIQVNYISITDLNNFRVKIDGCDIVLPAAFTDGHKDSDKNDEFKKTYENKYSTALVDAVSRDNM